ncbi:LAFA_0E07492g1_1 [Lachancea sp. 'fantastica']|nr:LAFA_0E07492g1_1 [Lachancea sp. 'fantastica']
MVKKNQNPHRINYQEGIINDCLLQVRNSSESDEPNLKAVWTVSIRAKDSQQFIKFIREVVQDYDPIAFQHIKRIKKGEQSGFLSVIVCSKLLAEQQDDFLELMKQSTFDFFDVSDKFEVPSTAPSTKELSLEWSELYWPLVWRGNPNDQIMNDYVFDMPFIKKMLDAISTEAAEQAKSSSNHPVVSAFVNPKTKKVIFSTDSRCSSSPLEHSIMQGIRSVAASEHKRQLIEDKQTEDETYLCLNFDVYTTHEPCSMCCMALIHSRIKRCIFLQPMRQTGALESQSGDGYCMHNNHALNSKYEAFRWIGPEYPVPKIASGICC